MTDFKKIAKETLTLEAQSLLQLVEQLGDDFNQCIEAMLASNGRIVLTGIGKSANIAEKIVATFNSTGTPSIFMHAADAVHGDLGIIQKDDIVICLSNSGNTPEIRLLVQFIKRFGNTVIAMTGVEDSYLAKNCDFVLNTHVEKEACPNNLAPTCSTTAQLAMGDALAVCLLSAKNFKEEDFAKYHPGGQLGKRLYLTMEELIVNNEIPSVTPDTTINDVIMIISTMRLGAAAVIDNNIIVGIVTDGDIRRMIQSRLDFNTTLAKDIMGNSPQTVDSNILAANAVKILRENNISQIIVTKNDAFLGIAHFHDFLKEGIL